MIGFSQALLDVTMDEQLELAVRQAAVIYLKNLINKAWIVDEDSKDVLPLSDQDKVPIRERIIECVVGSPEPIRYFLFSIFLSVSKFDF